MYYVKSNPEASFVKMPIEFLLLLDVKLLLRLIGMLMENSVDDSSILAKPVIPLLHFPIFRM